VIRALITAALTAGAAHQFLHVPLDAALGYSLVICLAGWYLWPLLRRPIRFLLRRLRPHRRGRTPMRRAAAAPLRTTPAQITQINHHHYYSGLPPQPAAAPLRPDYTLAALPRHTDGRIASDEILDGIIDIDDDTTR
jgi:hypothetical protein